MIHMLPIAFQVVRSVLLVSAAYAFFSAAIIVKESELDRFLNMFTHAINNVAENPEIQMVQYRRAQMGDMMTMFLPRFCVGLALCSIAMAVPVLTIPTTRSTPKQATSLDA